MIRLASILATAVALFLWGQPVKAQCPGGKCRIAPASRVTFPATHQSSDGNTYYRHPDGVYRISPAGGVRTTPLCDCCLPECKCDTRPKRITDTVGRTYTLQSDGWYHAEAGSLIPTGGCPNCRVR